jgi:hypothetical protein
MENQEAGWMIAAIALDTPEAALTLLIPLGATGIAALLPIIATICAILGAVHVSYRQTIAAYPDGGGSYTWRAKISGHGLAWLPALRSRSTTSSTSRSESRRASAR